MAGQQELYKARLQKMRPALDAVLDPVCVVTAQNEIIYSNLAMKGFLGLTGKDLKNHPVFCDLLKLPMCEKKCQLIETIAAQEMLRLDESPASRVLPAGQEKVRLILKIVPFSEDGAKGAIITVRDTSAEMILQAKYHKILQILQSSGS